MLISLQFNDFSLSKFDFPKDNCSFCCFSRVRELVKVYKFYFSLICRETRVDFRFVFSWNNFPRFYIRDLRAWVIVSWRNCIMLLLLLLSLLQFFLSMLIITYYTFDFYTCISYSVFPLHFSFINILKIIFSFSDTVQHCYKWTHLKFIFIQ